jgi:hypothetical protein
MRKRRRVDLMPLPGVSYASNGQPRDGNDETDNDAPEHEASPRNTIKVMRTSVRRGAAVIKTGCGHIPAFMTESVATQ